MYTASCPNKAYKTVFERKPHPPPRNTAFSAFIGRDVYKRQRMEYTIYKLEFQAGVHFGTGALDDGSYTFPADQLFSAMYIEAMKLGKAQKFYEVVKSGELLLSDALPYIDKQYLIPKPMIYVQTDYQLSLIHI